MYFVLDNDNSDTNYTTDSSGLSKTEADEILQDVKILLSVISKLYKANDKFYHNIQNKRNIAKSAITNDDVQSVIKLLETDITNYSIVSDKHFEILRKTYSSVKSNIESIEDANKSTTFPSIFNKEFAYKRLDNYLLSYKEDNIDSGLFYVKLTHPHDNESFKINVYKTFIKQLSLQLRKNDMIAHLDDNIIVVLIYKVTKSVFIDILNRIVDDVYGDIEIQKIISVSMISSFSDITLLHDKMSATLIKAEESPNKYLFA